MYKIPNNFSPPHTTHYFHTTPNNQLMTYKYKNNIRYYRHFSVFFDDLAVVSMLICINNPRFFRYFEKTGI